MKNFDIQYLIGNDWISGALAFDLISGIDNVTGILENPELWASSCSNLWLLEYWLAKQRSKLASLSLVNSPSELLQTRPIRSIYFLVLVSFALWVCELNF